MLYAGNPRRPHFICEKKSAAHLICDFCIGIPIEEDLDHSNVAVENGNHQRSLSVSVPCVHFCSVSGKKNRYILVSTDGRCPDNSKMYA